MNTLRQLRNAFHEPRMQGVDYTSDSLLQLHREILQEKPMMRQVFAEFYDLCMHLDQRHFYGTGSRIEIGAGVSFFKSRHPEVVATDIKRGDHLDLVLDAQKMNVLDSSVRAIYGINCFHHFPEPCKFFSELQRVLVEGGGCVLIEPYYGPVARRFYEHVHEVETFDPTQEQWESAGSSTRANQALSYIIFERDKERFRQLYPTLAVVERRPLNNYVRYLLSGGLNFKQVLPGVTSPALKVAEALLAPFNRLLALHHVIVITKLVRTETMLVPPHYFL